MSVVLILLTLNLLFEVVPIQGDSMLPTVKSGDRVLVLRVGDTARGDVVVFYNEDKASEHEKLIKRVIGLPGDIVETRLTGGKYDFYVNGEHVSETYISGNNFYEQPKITVPEGKFYYLGDNRTASEDSRYGHWGLLTDVIGKVLLRVNAVEGLDIAAVG